MDETGPDNPLQVALVRLRLENTPFRVLRRGDVAGPQPGGTWPFTEDMIVVLCRTTMEPGDRGPFDFALSTLSAAYMMSDGVERPIPLGPQYVQFTSLALATRGMWMSSGWSGH